MDKKKLRKKIKYYLSLVIPVILLLVGGVFFSLLIKKGGTSHVLYGFKSLLFWLSGLLALLGVASALNDLITFAEKCYTDRKAQTNEKKQTRFTRFQKHIVDFFSKLIPKKNGEPKTQTCDISDEPSAEVPDELNSVPSEMKNIRRTEAVLVSRQKEKNVFDKIRTLVFALIVISISIGLYFFCTKMFAASTPSAEADTYPMGLLTSLYFLFYAVILSIYTKMRTAPEKKGTYRISSDILKIVFCISIIYAGVIAVQSVLAINALAVIPWVIRAFVVYFAIVMAVDLIIAFLKGDTLNDLDYPFLPASEKGKDGVLDSDSVRARFSLKSIWSIRYALSLLPGIFLAIGAVLVLSTSLFVVQPGEQAALYRFGTITKDSIMDPGLHFKLPWPIDKVDFYDVDNITTVRIGYENPTGVDYLWTMSHGGEEYPLLTGNGNELVAVNIKLAYKINDLYSYVNTATDPESVLSAAAYESIMRRTVNTTLDAFLSVDRASLSGDLKSELCEFSESFGLGVEVVDVIIENIHPPVEVADVYQAVITASVDKETLITSARGEYIELINYAEYFKEEIINDALRKQSESIGAATGEMAYYYAAMEAYKVNPECFKLTKYIDVQEKRIAGTRVYYFSPKTEDSIGSFLIGGTTKDAVVTVE